MTRLNTDSKGFTLIEVLTACVIFAVVVAIVWGVTKGGFPNNDFYCKGANGVYPGWDPNRPPTVVPNDPNCRVGES